MGALGMKAEIRTMALFSVSHISESAMGLG